MSLYEEGQRIATESLDTSAVTVLSPSLFGYLNYTGRRMCKYGVFFWSAFSRIQSKYGPEKTPYFDTFYAVLMFRSRVFKRLTKFSLNSDSLLLFKCRPEISKYLILSGKLYTVSILTNKVFTKNIFRGSLLCYLINCSVIS